MHPALMQMAHAPRKATEACVGPPLPLTPCQSVTQTHPTRQVAKALKRVCADQRDAHVILVLSDATSVFYLPADLNRQTFV